MGIVVIDVGTSNITSVVNALEYVGGDVIVSNDPDDISNADKLVLPGVGAFGAGYEALKNHSLDELIRKHASADEKPILGICLGMQMLATASEEGGVFEGLNLIPGRVIRLTVDKSGYRVPNIGWCNISIKSSTNLIPEPESELSFYHVHSYYFDCADDQDVVATIDFSGKDIPVIVQNRNIYGVQFHPEKSQDNGLDLLHYFTKL